MQHAWGTLDGYWSKNMEKRDHLLDMNIILKWTGSVVVE